MYFVKNTMNQLQINQQDDFQSYKKPEWVSNFNWVPSKDEPQLKNQEVWISDKKIFYSNNYYKNLRSFTICIMGDDYDDYEYENLPQWDASSDVGSSNEERNEKDTFIDDLELFWTNKINKMIGKVDEVDEDDECSYSINIESKKHFSKFDIDTKVKEEDCDCAFSSPCSMCEIEKFKFIKFYNKSRK